MTVLRQNDDFLFYSTSVYNAFVVYINTMALSNKLHVHKQYRPLRVEKGAVYAVHSACRTN